MSRLYAFFGVVAAGGIGVITAYSTFQPELQRLKEVREGKRLPETQSPDDIKQQTVISDSIRSDLKEAKEQILKDEKDGFAWGIRKWLRGEYTQPKAADESKKT